MFPKYPIIYFLICGFVSLILWFKMLAILEKEGEKVNYLWVSPGQWIKFWRVIKREKNQELKRKYKILFWAQIALLPIYFIGMTILIALTA